MARHSILLVLVVMSMLALHLESWKLQNFKISVQQRAKFSPLVKDFICSFIVVPTLLLSYTPHSAIAQEGGSMSNQDIAQIVAEDITKRQALITADFSPSIYDPNCKFQDEIDTYEYNQYVKGTKALFNAAKSHVDLVGPVKATENMVEFSFKETLVFNIPFNPTVDISGHVELSRGGKDGLITYSHEFWDQPVGEVLSHVRFQ